MTPEERNCAACGESFVARDPRSMYCKPAHKQWPFRQRLKTKPKYPLPSQALFWRHYRVMDGTDCWIWDGMRDTQGYGVVMRGRARVRSHRIAYALTHGGMPPSTIYICHRCDNPPCINPGHLFAGTQKDNMADCSSKGRIRNGSHTGQQPRRNAASGRAQ